MKFATFHDLEDQSIFITGGGAGIGADLTKGFLSQGSKVMTSQALIIDGGVVVTG